MTRLPSRPVVLAALALAAGSLIGADRPACAPGGAMCGWRLDGSGVFADARPLLEWSQTTNILWRAKLPQWSHSSPVVAGDAVLCCAEQFTLLCLDRATGAIRWQKPATIGLATPPEELDAYRKNRVLGLAVQRDISRLMGPYWHDVAEARTHPDEEGIKSKLAVEQQRIDEAKQRLEPYLDAVEPGIHPACGWSVYTPITDGQHVWAVFANGVAICCDLKGHQVWMRRIERPPPQDQFSESPLLVDGKLVVHLTDLKAFDAATGAPAWSVAGVRKTYGTPVAVSLGPVGAVLTPSGWLVRVADGRVLATGLGWLSNASPIVHGDVVYFIEGDALALRLPSSDAEPVRPLRLWQTRNICDPSLRDEVFCASPLWLDGIIYQVSRIGLFVAIDASDGAVIYAHQLEGTHDSFTSIASAGGHLFVSSADGTTFVLTPGRTFEEVACNHLAPSRAMPQFAGSRMYVRAQDELLCIGR